MAEGCTHAGTINGCNQKPGDARVCRYGSAAVFWDGGGGVFIFVVLNRRADGILRYTNVHVAQFACFLWENQVLGNWLDNMRKG